MDGPEQPYALPRTVDRPPHQRLAQEIAFEDDGWYSFEELNGEKTFAAARQPYKNNDRRVSDSLWEPEFHRPPQSDDVAGE